MNAIGKNKVACINVLNSRRADWSLFASGRSKTAKAFSQKIEDAVRSCDAEAVRRILDEAVAEFGG